VERTVRDKVRRAPFAALSFVLAALGVCAGNAATLKPTAQRDWHFPVANSPVIVRLSSTQSTEGGQPIYALQIISGRAVPSVTDEAAFLQTVTKAMESEGMQPTRIGLLLLDMNEPDVSEQLSKAAYESDEWHEAKASNHASVIIKLLNSIGAYKPFNRVFSQYGLT